MRSRGARVIFVRSSADAVTGDNQELIELIGMVSEDMAKPDNFQAKIGVGAQPKIDNAHVRLATMEHERTKVAVVGNEHPLFTNGDGKHLKVWQTRRIVAANASRIMPLFLEKREQPRIGALIQQKSHASPLAFAVCSSYAASVSWAKASAALTSSMVNSG